VSVSRLATIRQVLAQAAAWLSHSSRPASRRSPVSRSPALWPVARRRDVGDVAARPRSGIRTLTRSTPPVSVSRPAAIRQVPPPRRAVRPCRVHERKVRLCCQAAPASRRGHGGALPAKNPAQEKTQVLGYLLSRQLIYCCSSTGRRERIFVPENVAEIRLPPSRISVITTPTRCKATSTKSA